MRERQVENDIVSALENGELQLYVQPKVDMRDGRVIGGEALVRRKHPKRWCHRESLFPYWRKTDLSSM